MNFWHPIKEYRERKQKRIEETIDAVSELEQKLNNPKQATLLAPSLIEFKKNHPKEDYEIFTGTQKELSEKGYDNSKLYTLISQRFVAPGMSSDKIWDMQLEKRRAFAWMDNATSQYEDFIEANMLARDKYEPIYGIIVPKDKK